MEFPAGLKYTKGPRVGRRSRARRSRSGITAFAVEQLGDITLVTIDAKVGDELTARKGFGNDRGVKTLSDLRADQRQGCRINKGPR